MKTRERKNLLAYVVLLLAASCLVFIASYSTSPIYPFYKVDDSAQFQTVGREWALGKIPYRDTFDHKGPIIFFINMIGYYLTGSATGIVGIQILCLFFSLLYIFRMSQIACGRKIYGFFACLVFVAFLTQIYGEGNKTEEYCLPFICASTFFQYRYLQKETDKAKEHNLLWAVLYGLTFGVCFLTRVTNAVSICSGVLVICVILLVKKKYKNLLLNALSFIAGFLLITIPFLIYFQYYGVLEEFFYATLLYNIEYEKKMSAWVSNAQVTEWIQYGKLYFTSYTIFFTAIFSFTRKNKNLGIYCILCGVLETCLYMSGALYTQYAIVTLPQIVLLLNEIVRISEKDKRTKYGYGIILLIMTGVCIFLDAKFVVRSVKTYQNNREYVETGYEKLLNRIPEDERDFFVAYGDNRLKGLYLLEDISPCYKYFSIQEWHAKYSEYIKADMIHTFEQGNARWILTCGSTDNIQRVLDTRYECVEQMGDYSLYRMIE